MTLENQNTSPSFVDRRMQGRAGASFAGAIEFDQVSFRVGPLQILQDLSLHFAAGKVTCLLGESGCGKTTVLRLAAGVARPNSGRIRIGGFDVVAPQVFVPPERRNVGLMFQDYALFPHLTVLQNVAFGLYALSKTEAQVAAMTALERVGLSHLAQRFPNYLSGGEQQRVALARAIVPRPQVLLMDEPFSGLDQRLREQVRADALAIVRETHATAVLVTHDPHEAMVSSDYIILMREGKIAQHGTPQELYSTPKTARVAQFFDRYVEFSGVVQNGAVDLPIGKISCAEHSDGQAVDILIRQDGLRPVFNGLGVSAYVLDQRKLGNMWHVRLVFSGQEKPVEITLPQETAVATGEMHDFVINPASVLVFKKPDAMHK
jgi:iron(III) transport system ATP-binding protein